MLKELKEFLMRGNVVDLAVGIIIGGAADDRVPVLPLDDPAQRHALCALYVRPDPHARGGFPVMT